METFLEDIRNQQKESWNKFSPGWKKWDDLIMDFLNPMGEEIIKALNIKNTDIVLDVASGTGEPGFSIAKIVTNGTVILTDLSEDMLKIAHNNAINKGLKNIETCISDVSELPFHDNMFDAVSCRFGFMFFPDMVLAIKEMMRVLKPGGKIAIGVWSGPEKNFWVTAAMGAINRNMQLAPPPPEAPGMFRCAKDGLMVELFQNVGLRDVYQKEVTEVLQCKTAELYWEMMTEVAAPFVSALNQADDDMKQKIKEEVFQTIHEKFPKGDVNISASSLLICGEKPK